MKTIHIICAARPNFMKIAPLYHALKAEDWCVPKIIHTGQHYDYQMSQAFFDDLGLPSPSYNLGVGSGSHGQQTAHTMMAYEKLCVEEDMPHLVIVVGDVNATLACSISAKKLHLSVAHLEAGLRSFDRTMPEEINRIVTDSISDYHWTPSEDADENLLREGVRPEQLSRVGNIMIDSYCLMKTKIDDQKIWGHFDLSKKSYGVLTLHRPTNVDDPEILCQILGVIRCLDIPTIFPVHPRTKKAMESLKAIPENIKLVDPMGYIEFMSLVSESAFVITDSGGIQEETTYLKVPCFTLRDTTERPITITLGTNQLVTPDNLIEKLSSPKKGEIPPLWDGNTADRIVEVLKDVYK